MSTFQPLYFSGGRYAAATDRKLIASLIASETNGTRVSGVVPAGISTGSLLVSSAGANTISIAPGMCMIPDNTSPNATSGMYLAGIQGSAETRTFSTNNGTNTRTDSVYAVVDETSYTITKKAFTSATSTCTLTTSDAHGFKVGETVTVSGVDEFFDGYHSITAVTTTSPYTFSYEKSAATDVTEVGIFAEVRLGARWAAVRQKTISSNLVTLAISTTAGEYAGTQFGSGDAGSFVTVKGVDPTIDGTHVLAGTISSSQVQFYLNKPVLNVSATPTSAATQNSAVAVARVPFSIKIDEANAGAFSAKTKIRLATYTVPAGGGTLATVTDTRQFVTTMGGVHYYNSTATAPAAAAGRFRYNTATNTLEYYTTSWNTLLALGTTSTTAAAGNHNHDSVYATTGHTHTGFALTSHTHSYDDLDNIPPEQTPTCTFVGVDAPKSDGVSDSNTISISSTSYANITGVSTTISLSAATFCVIQWACNATAGSSGEIYVAPAVSGTTTVNATPSYATTTHGSAATDGTAYSDGDVGVNKTTTSTRLTGTRLVKLNSGSNVVTLQAKRVTANGTVSSPTIRVIPLRFV